MKSPKNLRENEFLIIGLGNPGAEFAGNRHNLGKMILTGLARQSGANFISEHPKADTAKIKINSTNTILAVLKDYMNQSGFGVEALCNFWDIGLDNLVIVHDDLDIPFAVVRIKKGGGSGGHNGLKSIIDIMGRDDFIRVRVGIGRPPGKQDPVDYVLKDFTVVQFAEMEFVLYDVIDAIKMIVTEGIEAAMNRYNIRGT